MNKELDQFSEKLLEKTLSFIKDEFHFKSEFENSLFHFTSAVPSDAILKSQVFYASAIRSTSDPLEFALPLSMCRDWLCVEKRLVPFEKFPGRFFSDFNEMARNPKLRLYFISFCENSKSENLLERYGDKILEFKKTKQNDGTQGYLMKCKYVKNPAEVVFDLLDQWKKDAFEPIAKEFSVNPQDTDKLKYWYYIFMHFCTSISSAIKQHAFNGEHEVRLILCSREPASETSWHQKVQFELISKPTMLYREYLPVKLKELGLSVYQVLADLVRAPWGKTIIYNSRNF